jgi:predicted phage terminase large subunit-like protein
MEAIANPTTTNEEIVLPVTPQFPRRYNVGIRKVEDWWIEKSRVNPVYFGQYVFDLEAAAHHKIWIYTILEAAAEGKPFLIVAPRESAKTTWMMILMTWIIGKFPLKTNFIGSVTSDQAEERLGMVKGAIENNQRFKNVFPGIVPDPRQAWNKGQATIKRTMKDDGSEMPYSVWRSMAARGQLAKNPTVYASGVTGSGVVGHRFDGMSLIDDPHSQKNSMTPLSRQNIGKWYFTEYVNCIAPGCLYGVITTRWAEDDLAGQIMAIDDTPFIAELPDVIGSSLDDIEYEKPEEVLDILEQEPLRVKEMDNSFYKVIETPAIFKTGEINPKTKKPILRSYWPEHWPMERLLRKRREVGTPNFRANYLNDIRALSGDIFKMEWLLQDLPEKLPPLKGVVVSVDIAHSQKQHNDYTAIVIMAIDYHHNFYVLEGKKMRASFGERLQTIAIMAQNAYIRYGRMDAVIFEKTAAQIDSIEEFRKNYSLPLATHTPIVDKRTRSRFFASRCEDLRVYVKQDAPWTIDWQSELVVFDRGVHDDWVDATSQAANYWGPVGGITDPSMEIITSEFFR